MTLARTALRLQGVLTLLTDPVIDALCQGRVYDSRIGDFDQREPVPTIILTTEEDDAPAFSKNNGGVPFDHTCDLVLEIAMTMVGTVPNAAGAMVDAIGNPATDSQLEAYLDLIEHAAVEALTVGETAEARLLRRAVTRRITKCKSSRFATEEGVRLAIRMVTLTTELKGEDQRDVTIGITGPYATLPEPLRSVARAMPAGFSGRTTCDLLASLIPAATDTPLRGADIAQAPSDFAAGTPNRNDDIGAGRIVGQTIDLPIWTP